MKTKKNRIYGMDDRAIDIIACILGGLVFVATLYPLIFVVSASFSEPSNVLEGKVILWPIGFTLEGYERGCSILSGFPARRDRQTPSIPVRYSRSRSLTRLPPASYFRRQRRNHPPKTRSFSVQTG